MAATDCITCRVCGLEEETMVYIKPSETTNLRLVCEFTANYKGSTVYWAQNQHLYSKRTFLLLTPAP